MKNLIFILKAVLLIFVLQSCEEVSLGGGNVPDCEWNDNNTVVFYDLQLNHPTGLNTYHQNIIPLDNIERSLINILETNGDAANGENSAYVRVNIKSDGTTCTGEEMVKYLNSEYFGNVGISDIQVPFTSNAVFFGEVTVIIRTDVFNNTVGSDAFYHVVWDETGNDPNGGFVGNILGVKISYINIDGTQSILVGGQDGYLYSGGVKNWL